MAKFNVPYFKWRNGRPRWEPGPHLRARGFRGQDLKDAAGNWLPEGAAIDAARALNAAVRPSDALSDEKRPPTNPALRTMSALFDLYRADRGLEEKLPRPQPGVAIVKRGLARRTREGYAYHLRLLEQWCGDVPAAQLTRAAIKDFYATLEEDKGLATANAVMRTLRMALNFAVDELEWIHKNRAAKLDLSAPDGRLVVWELEEIKTFVAAADYLDLASQGDALMLGAMSGQRQADVIVLPESALADGRYVLTQQKTGKLVRVPAVAPLRDRIDAARARKAKRWPNIARTNPAELINERTGLPYHPDGSYFRELFALVRDFAGGLTNAAGELLDFSLPPPTDNLPFTPRFSILAKRWSDLRDTAVTWLFAAGCDIAEICSYTGHSLATAQAILDRHYFVRDDAIAAAAGKKLETFLQRSGW